MTTNREWLFSLTLEEYLEWMESAHYEPNPDCSAMLYKLYTENMKYEPCSDHEPKDDVDSRDKIEADVREIVEAYNMDTQRHGSERFAHELYYSIIHLLDRQAAITEREVEHDLMKAGRMAVEVERERIKKLTAERDELKELNEYHALQYELASEDADRLQAQVDELTAERVKLRSQICKLEDDLVRTSDERDNWKANCEDWKNHARAAENACYETMLEREDYRKKFGKCIDYADAIHALMDEGMA